ncbi:hypothetical protein MMC09_000173 [Bachmanniomyces sp. S44760]|nr:hypothetical protein [Bachmanniomyces sp. S44760]
MTEASPRSRSATPSSIPQKRLHVIEDDQHIPAVSSPLNPDYANSRSRRPAAPREQREKKESLKKREAKGVDNARSATPDSQGPAKNLSKGSPELSNVLSPIRYKLPAPKSTDFDPPKPPIFVPSLSKGGKPFFESSEHVYNRKGFRYTHCIADPTFPSSQYHRQSETEPFGPRINFEDVSSHVHFDAPGQSVTTEKGFRMARANVGAREGRWYWECKVLSGVKATQEGDHGASGEPGGHVRLGWARREASLDTPVGFDAYSYGLRDVASQKVHMSRPKDFLPLGEDLRVGDIIGLEIDLPSLILHRKVVEGSYNKAVDISDDVEPQGAEAPDIIRDRVPIRYKAHLYFEQFEYHSTKELEELMNPSPVIATSSASTTQAPNPNHPLPALRTLPFSGIKVYKNGKYIGTPFKDLLAFLPPASKPLNQVGARDGLDDGMLGYFPSISVFRGGAAEANFGPHFWFPPADLCVQNKDDDKDIIMANTTTDASPNTATRANTSTSLRLLRPLSERYNEQIAEDIVYDIIDEVDFWMQDGGDTDSKSGVTDQTPTVLGPVDPEIPGLNAMAAEEGDVGDAVGDGRGDGEIKEIVQEDE